MLALSNREIEVEIDARVNTTDMGLMVRLACAGVARIQPCFANDPRTPGLAQLLRHAWLSISHADLSRTRAMAENLPRRTR